VKRFSARQLNSTVQAIFCCTADVVARAIPPKSWFVKLPTIACKVVLCLLACTELFAAFRAVQRRRPLCSWYALIVVVRLLPFSQLLSLFIRAIHFWGAKHCLGRFTGRFTFRFTVGYKPLTIDPRKSYYYPQSRGQMPVPAQRAL
jgi:hypothetical protein